MFWGVWRLFGGVGVLKILGVFCGSFKVFWGVSRCFGVFRGVLGVFWCLKFLLSVLRVLWGCCQRFWGVLGCVGGRRGVAGNCRTTSNRSLLTMDFLLRAPPSGIRKEFETASFDFWQSRDDEESGKETEKEETRKTEKAVVSAFCLL